MAARMITSFRGITCRTAAIFAACSGLLVPVMRAQGAELARMHDGARQLQQLLTQRRYDDAVRLGSSLLQNASKYPPGQPQVLEDRIEMALALKFLGRFSEAEIQYRAIISASSKREPSQILSRAYYDLSGIAFFDGRTFEASTDARLALRIQRDLPRNDALIAGDLLQVAICSTSPEYDVIDRINWLNEAKSLLGTSDSSRSQRVNVLHLLANLYSNVGDDAKVTSAFRELEALVSTPVQIAQLKLQRAVYERDGLIQQGRFAEAERVHEWLRLLPGAQSPSRGLFARASDSLSEAEVYFRTGDYNKALAAFRQGIEQFRELYRSQMHTLTEEERNQIGIRLKSQAAEFLSFCIVYHPQHPELLSEAYEMLLWQKALVSASLRADRVSNATSPNGYSAPTAVPLPTAAAVRSALPLEDAAVEVARFLQMDVDGALNRTVYAALIMLPGRDHAITMIELGDQPALLREQEQMQAVLRSKDPQPARPVYSSTTWLRMESALKGARRIYMSTAGTLDAAAFYAWKHSDGRYLLDHDEIDIRPVFSTSELTSHPEPPEQQDAMLIGNPDFGGGSTSAAAPSAPASEDTGVDSAAIRAATGSYLTALPQTHAELVAIYKELVTHRYKVRNPLEGQVATVNALLSAKHPAILHIATHGFFVPSDETDELTSVGLRESLQRSGLFFANANQSLNSPAPNRGSLTGVVTAFEITGMDLRGTDLVVLSACETGLGQHGESGEDLGLRRSFHIAGGQHLLASLWEVDDAATAEIMQAFYRNWLNGKDQYDSLRLAAQQVRKTHPQPYYWTPYVLYGP